MGESFDFELPDAGSAGDSRTAADLSADHDYVLAVLLRSHYCPRSRQFVRKLAAEYDAFAGRSTAVVPVLPDRRERAAVWQRRYDLPFGLLADPAGDADGDDGFGAFAPFAALLQRTPGVVLFEADGNSLRFRGTVGGDAGDGGPTVAGLLADVDDHVVDGVAGPVEAGADAGAVTDG